MLINLFWTSKRPTLSLYSKLVLFIKKKDSSLCFYVNFHSLNYVTKNNFYPPL